MSRHRQVNSLSCLYTSCILLTLSFLHSFPWLRLCLRYIIKNKSSSFSLHLLILLSLLLTSLTFFHFRQTRDIKNVSSAGLTLKTQTPLFPPVLNDIPSELDIRQASTSSAPAISYRRYQSSHLLPSLTLLPTSSLSGGPPDISRSSEVASHGQSPTASLPVIGSSPLSK